MRLTLCTRADRGGHFAFAPDLPHRASLRKVPMKNITQSFIQIKAANMAVIAAFVQSPEIAQWVDARAHGCFESTQQFKARLSAQT